MQECRFTNIKATFNKCKKYLNTDSLLSLLYINIKINKSKKKMPDINIDASEEYILSLYKSAEYIKNLINIEKTYNKYLKGDKKCKELLIEHTRKSIINCDVEASPILIVFGKEIVKNAVKLIDKDEINQSILDYIINLELYFSESTVACYDELSVCNKEAEDETIYNYIIDFVYWFITEKNLDSIEVAEFYLLPVLKKIKDNKNLSYSAILAIAQIYTNGRSGSLVCKYAGDIVGDFFALKIRKCLDKQKFKKVHCVLNAEEIKDLEFIGKCLELRYGEKCYNGSINYCIDKISYIKSLETYGENCDIDDMYNLLNSAVLSYVGVSFLCSLWDLYTR